MNTNEVALEPKKGFENLTVEKRREVLEWASRSERLADVLKPLKENGIEVSLSTLRRFVMRHREEGLVEAGKDMRTGAAALAGLGNGTELRRGALEVIRQRVYERSLSMGAEESREVYGELLREEALWKELELKERKVAVAEEEARLGRARLRMEANRAGRRARAARAGEVVVGAAAAEGTEGKTADGREELTANRHELTRIGNGTGGGEKVHHGEHGEHREELERAEARAVKESARAEEAWSLLREVAGIVNRGGDLGEKLMEARMLLGTVNLEGAV